LNEKVLSLRNKPINLKVYCVLQNLQGKKEFRKFSNIYTKLNWFQFCSFSIQIKSRLDRLFHYTVGCLFGLKINLSSSVLKRRVKGTGHPYVTPLPTHARREM